MFMLGVAFLYSQFSADFFLEFFDFFGNQIQKDILPPISFAMFSVFENCLFGHALD